jgi:hypothetical protein
MHGAETNYDGVAVHGNFLSATSKSRHLICCMLAPCSCSVHGKNSSTNCIRTFMHPYMLSNSLVHVRILSVTDLHYTDVG